MKKIGKRMTSGWAPSLAVMMIPSLISLAARGATEVEALINHDQVGLKTPFDLSIVVTSDEDVSVSDPKVIAPEGLELVSPEPSRSTSTSSQLFQGAHGMQFQTKHSYEFHYQMKPTQLGKIVIPSYPVVIGKDTLKTKAITLDVPKVAKAKPDEMDIASDDPLDELQAQFMQLQGRNRRGGGSGAEATGPPLTEEEARQQFFLKLEVDKTNVYAGEQVVANWWMYTRVNILDLDQVKVPDLKGFWKETLEQPSNLQFSQEIINGIPYRRALLLSDALFPLKEGTATIDGFRIKATTQGGPFSQPIPYVRVSEPKDIHVEPLPSAGKPDSFTGAVGQFEVKADVDQKNPRVDQPFSLKVKFQGIGNAKMIELPPMQFPDGLEKFDVKSSSQFQKNGTGAKEFEILLIPRKAGKFDLPAMSFGFFDPATKSYNVKTTSAIAVEATGSSAPGTETGTVASATPEAASKVTSPLILQPTPETFFDTMKWALLATLDLILLIAILIFAFLRWPRLERLPHGEEILRRTKKQAEARLNKNDYRGAANVVMNGVHSFFSDILKVSPSHAEIHLGLALLPNEQREKATVDYFESQRYFEKLAFSPEKDSTELHKNQMFKKNLQTILSICGDVLKKKRV